MINTINNAFAALDAKLIANDQAWANAKLDGFAAFRAEAEAGFKANDPKFNSLTSGYGRFCYSAAAIQWFGSKAMVALITGRGREGGLQNMQKNTEALIAKRNAQIIKALIKAEVTELPAFELVESSDGYEGWFKVGDKTVSIRTILAGGYNIQRLHQRTLVKVS